MTARGISGLDPDQKKYEILIIDRMEHFEDVSENWRSVVDTEHFSAMAVKFSDMIHSFKSEYVSFMQAMLTSIDENSNKIEVTKLDGSSEQVSYDALILSTGGTYP